MLRSTGLWKDWKNNYQSIASESLRSTVITQSKPSFAESKNIYWIIQNNILMRTGLNPDRMFIEAAAVNSLKTII